MVQVACKNNKSVIILILTKMKNIDNNLFLLFYIYLQIEQLKIAKTLGLLSTVDIDPRNILSLFPCLLVPIFLHFQVKLLIFDIF